MNDPLNTARVWISREDFDARVAPFEAAAKSARQDYDALLEKRSKIRERYGYLATFHRRGRAILLPNSDPLREMQGTISRMRYLIEASDDGRMLVSPDTVDFLILIDPSSIENFKWRIAQDIKFLQSQIGKWDAEVDALNAAREHREWLKTASQTEAAAPKPSLGHSAFAIAFIAAVIIGAALATYHAWVGQ